MLKRTTTKEDKEASRTSPLANSAPAPSGQGMRLTHPHQASSDRSSLRQTLIRLAGGGGDARRALQDLVHDDELRDWLRRILANPECP